jgi:hypothetical protein
MNRAEWKDGWIMVEWMDGLWLMMDEWIGGWKYPGLAGLWLD